MVGAEVRIHARLCEGDLEDIALVQVATVGPADPGRDVPVCYCLRVTRGTILDAVLAGEVRTSEDAKRITKACTGKACHIVNPGGICCGDQLRDAVALGLELAGADREEVEAALQEDPGATCCGRTLSKVRGGSTDDAACCFL